MPAKQLLSGEEARRAIRHGVNKLANAVKVTLRAKEGDVALDKKFAAPTVPKRGGTERKRPTGPPRHWPSPSSTKKGRP